MLDKTNNCRRWTSSLLMLAALSAGGLTGCQSTVGGQNLPSGYYLLDDVQYFPAGPDYLLYNTERAYKQRQEDSGDASGGGGGGGY